MIKRARNSEVKVHFEVDHSIFNSVVNLTKEVINRDISECQINDIPTKLEDLCFRHISLEITDTLVSQLKGNWTVTTGQYNKCFTYLRFEKLYIQSFDFQLGDLYFEIINFA